MRGLAQRCTFVLKERAIDLEKCYKNKGVNGAAREISTLGLSLTKALRRWRNFDFVAMLCVVGEKCLCRIWDNWGLK